MAPAACTWLCQSEYSSCRSRNVCASLTKAKRDDSNENVHVTSLSNRATIAAGPANRFTMTALIDTNVLVYRYDARFPDKQAIASRPLWAYAEHYGFETHYSEDFQHGAILRARTREQSVLPVIADREDKHCHRRQVDGRRHSGDRMRSVE